MKLHSTNYFNTFIEVSDDTKVNCGTQPPSKGKKTVAEMQYERIVKNPYKYTSDDIIFQVHADRNNLINSEHIDAREQFFSKGQPCFRASPLSKRYGFGVHSDIEGKIAIYGIESEEYHQFVADPSVKKVKAMRTSKK